MKYIFQTLNIYLGGSLINLILLWLGSILVCYGIDVFATCQMIKDVGKQGYKLNIVKGQRLSNFLEKDSKKFKLLVYFIPIVNVCFQTIKLVNYFNKDKFSLIEQLRPYDCIEEFTKEEQEKYREKPTCLNALRIASASLIKEKDKILILSYMENNKESKIYHHTDENGIITVLKATGPAMKLTTSEQEAKITELYDRIASDLAKRFNTTEEAREYLNTLFAGSKNIVEIKIPIQTTPKAELESLREFLLNKTQELKNSEKGISKIKK